MTNPDKQSRADTAHGNKHDKDSTDGQQQSHEDAPGKQKESAYPNDDYWEQGVGEKSRQAPDESPEPDTGYRWESTEENSSPDNGQKDSGKGD